MGIETLQLAGMGVSALGAYKASSGAKTAYEAQSRIAANNAQIAGWQADDAIARGGKAATTSRMKTLQLKGDQRAAMAANGVDLGVGSAAEILTDTDYFGAIDANTITDNAAREAWGFRSQGANFSNESSLLRSRADAESPWLNAGTSLLTSANRVASSWYGPAGAGGRTGLRVPAFDDPGWPASTGGSDWDRFARSGDAGGETPWTRFKRRGGI